MAILTLAEYKASPFYDADTQTDGNIEYFIDFIDDIIRMIRGIDFFEFTADITNGSTSLVNVFDKYEYTFSGALIETKLSDYLRGKITSKGIDRENAEITVDTSAAGTDTDVDIIIYPRNAQMVGAELIKYLITSLGVDQTMKSESIGTYSYTRGDDFITVMGYSIPGFIVNKIQRFHGVK